MSFVSTMEIWLKHLQVYIQPLHTKKISFPYSLVHLFVASSLTNCVQMGIIKM